MAAVYPWQVQSLEDGVGRSSFRKSSSWSIIPSSPYRSFSARRQTRLSESLRDLCTNSTAPEVSHLTKHGVVYQTISMWMTRPVAVESGGNAGLGNGPVSARGQSDGYTLHPSENPHRADLHESGCIRVWLRTADNRSLTCSPNLSFVVVSNLRILQI